MSIIRYSMGTVSALMIAAGVYFGPYRGKDADATRERIEQAMANLELRPEGKHIIEALDKELSTLDGSRDGKASFAEIRKKIIELGGNPKSEDVTRILNDASGQANARWATQHIGGLGAVTVGSLLLGLAVTAPTLCGLLSKLGGPSAGTKEDQDATDAAWRKVFASSRGDRSPPTDRSSR